MMGFVREDPNDKFRPFEDPKTFDGKNAYDVLREREDCPIRLPSARSMTQAMIDYRSNAHAIVNWYNTINGKL